MPSYAYSTVISNSYLGRTKVIKAPTRYELDVKVQDQLAQWERMEARERGREAAKRQADEQRVRTAEARREAEAVRSDAAAAKESAKREAEDLTQEAAREIEAYRTILQTGLSRAPAVPWDSLLLHRQALTFAFAPPCPQAPAEPKIRPFLFAHAEPQPSVAEVRGRLGVPSTNALLETVVPGRRRRRLSLEEQALAEHAREVQAWHDRAGSAESAAKQRWSEERDRLLGEHSTRMELYRVDSQAWQEARAEALRHHEGIVAAQREEQRQRREEVAALKAAFESGEPDALLRGLEIVLEASPYPDATAPDVSLGFDVPSGTLVVSCPLPSPSDMPTVTGYRFVATRGEVVAQELKQKDRDALYESVVQQIALRTVHEVFSVAATERLAAVVFNGWVSGIDRKTGQPFTSCILSCRAEREQFGAINLAEVDPRECLRGLRALDAGPLAQLAPVRPLMDLDTTDRRFVESREVLGQMDPGQNLAAMDWESFEHLVRELCELMFSTGDGEVRVTQASRDGGVDAVAFDPDPIRGGKFVIQAKRYSNVVPVAAVRDLYGTMINEGAVKGILVTTSYYGNDSRTFAQDKPITLIDGSNLVYLLQQYGYADAHIDLDAARHAGAEAAGP